MYSVYSGQSQPCNQLQLQSSEAAKVRLLSISNAYRRIRLGGKYQCCLRLRRVLMATGDQVDSLQEKKDLTSVQCKRTWDRLAMYVDREYLI